MTAGIAAASVPLATTTATTTTTTTAPASAASATTAATQQAAQGAQAAQPQAEAFNAPMLDLPDDPSTRDVMNGLVGAMADPTMNASTAQALLDLHKQLMAAQQAMSEAMRTVNQDVQP
jgi:hypothetical protein